MTLLLVAVLAAAPMEHLRVELKFTLVHADGKREANASDKVWYFEVPAKRADDKSMNELLHRIFWDQNVAMRQREPGDHAYLSLLSFKTSKVDLAAVKASKGTDPKVYGWLDAQRAVVWEPSAEFIVDDQGRYDNIGGNDYTELLLHRMYERKLIDEAGFVAFFDAYNSAKTPGRMVFDGREKRLKSLTEIRGVATNAPGSGTYRKAVGAKPIASGPIDSAVK
ncbi:MAG: hypothetical protein Q8L48_10855 [Archangium sp.]|nr:hypothetical protein [Archangium sp.]